MRHHLNSLAGAVLGASALLIASTAQAAESGAGFYLLGSKGPGAALLPPPGVFFSKDMYYYSGSLGGNLKLPTTGGKLAVGVDGNAFIVLPTVLWVLPEDIGGAHAALALTLPYGWKKTSAGVTFDGPLLGHRETGVSDSAFTYGDPVVTGMLGWQTGNFHWQAGTMINVPIGDYQKDEISNIAFNHWGADVFAAATYFDPATGWDFSNVVGMTFNAENPATDYRTGNEFHYETAISKQFNEKFSAGILGYYYDQLTGDSGDGARSAFKGRVAALGATVAWNFKFGDVPVSARLKYFHEFAAENRAEGDAVFATISMPLYVYPPVKN